MSALEGLTDRTPFTFELTEFEEDSRVTTGTSLTPLRGPEVSMGDLFAEEGEVADAELGKAAALKLAESWRRRPMSKW